MTLKAWPIRFMLSLGLTLAVFAGCGQATGPSGPTSAPLAVQTKGEKFAVSFTADAAPASQEPPRAQGAAAHTDTQDHGQSLGSIVGAVKWSGPLPTFDPILVNKDTHACAEHGKHDRPPEQLIVNSSSGGVKDAVVHLVGKFEDAGTPGLSEFKYPDTLNQRMCSYEPRVFVIPAGARLAMTSEDEVGHNVRMSGAADLNIAISKGGRTTRRMEQAGVVKLGCDIHPWMTGYIHVVRHPYYAVTDSDGRFELKDVPDGTHSIRLWHEPWWTEDGKLASPIHSTHSITVRPGETTMATFELSDPALTQWAKTSPAQAVPKR
jgi:hypothetical protein